MGDLVLYLGITLIGYIIGSRLRSRREKLTWTGKVQTVAMIVLVLTMGMRMGANEEITANLRTIGLSAFCMTVAATAGAVVCVSLLRRAMGLDRYGRLIKKKVAADLSDGKAASTSGGRNASPPVDTGRQPPQEAAAGAAAEKGAAPGEREKASVNLMTLLIVAAVAAGMAAGYIIIRKAFAGNMAAFDSAAGLAIKIGLCVLLYFVGMDLGLDGTMVKNIREVGLRILAFPFACAAGTLIGAALTFPFFDLTLRESLAVGAGFSWYTLAPGIIMEAGHLTASAVSFLHNVMREFCSILLIPTVAARLGYIECTAMAGAAAMDVCLPIAERATRSDIAVYSFVSGLVLSILVPVLVPIIIG